MGVMQQDVTERWAVYLGVLPDGRYLCTALHERDPRKVLALMHKDAADTICVAKGLLPGRFEPGAGVWTCRIPAGT